MNKIEEKLELAKALGMSGFVASIEAHKEAMGLMEMHFTPTSRDVVREKVYWQAVRARIFDKRTLFMSGNSIMFLTFLVLSLHHVFSVIPPNSTPGFLSLVGLLFGIVFGIVFGVGGFMGVISRLFIHTVNTVSLHNWQHDTPYGALLASKEARERGFCNFEVTYPVSNPKDPIITAYTPKGNMVEIFNWDEKKLYAE